VIDLYDGPPVAGSEVPEVAPSSSGPSVPPAPLALEVAQPPAALTWDGVLAPVETLPTELEVTEPEPELPRPTAEPRRMTLSWRQLLPRFLTVKLLTYFMWRHSTHCMQYFKQILLQITY